jgi:hypothetical protein
MEEKIQDLKNFSLADLYCRRIPMAGKKPNQKSIPKTLLKRPNM